MNLKDLLEALQYGDKMNNDNIQLFSEGRDLSKWEKIKTLPFYEELTKEILDKGENYLNDSMKVTTYSNYRIYSATGSRKEYEREYFEKRARLNTFAILSMVYDEPKYIHALEDILWSICDEYTWCVPAHAPDGGNSIVDDLNISSFENGIIKGKIRDHSKTIDLFSSETGFALSEIISLVEEKLSPIVVYRARNEIRKRILEPYCELNNMFFWETSPTNWSAVCGGSIGIAAMYLIPEASVLTPIIYRVLGTMDAFLNGYHEDGACIEGLAYWGYGFGFFVFFAELLKQRTAGKIDMMKSKKVKEIALFQQKCYLSEDKIISFSDSPTFSKFRLGLTHHLKDCYDEIKIPDNKYRDGFDEDKCYRWGHNIRNFVWSNPLYAKGSLEVGSYYLEQSQWFISKYTTDKDVICFAAKGGHNDEPHNHNDIGSFIFHVNGESLLTDIGMGEYTKQYFGPERYSLLCNSSEGHSVPIIDGRGQGTGREYYGKIVESKIGKERDILVVDMAKAYNNNNLHKYVRKFYFEKDYKCQLVLEDEFQFNNASAMIIERFISFQEPKIIDKGTVRINGGNKYLDILYHCEAVEYQATKHNFINHSSEHVTVYALDFKCKALNNKVKFEVKFIPGVSCY